MEKTYFFSFSSMLGELMAEDQVLREIVESLGSEEVAQIVEGWAEEFCNSDSTDSVAFFYEKVGELMDRENDDDDDEDDDDADGEDDIFSIIEPALEYAGWKILDGDRSSCCLRSPNGHEFTLDITEAYDVEGE